MADPVLCAKCRRPVRAEAEFCPSCGQRLKKSCINTACDAVLSFADTHCFRCGARQITGGGVLTSQAAIEAVKVAPDLIKGGLGCLKDMVVFLGIPGIIVVVVLMVLNSLTGGFITNLLFGWILTAIGGWVVLTLLVFAGYQIYKRGLLGRLMQTARESGQRNRARRLEQQRQRAQAAALPRPIAPPPPASVLPPPPPETMAAPIASSPLPAPRRTARRAKVVQPVPPAPVQRFSKQKIDAQIGRVAVHLSLGDDRTQAQEIVNEAIQNLELDGNEDFSAAVLKKAVDEVYGGPSI